MGFIFYTALFLVSMVLTLVYTVIWHKHFNVHITLMFTIIPIACMGYVMLAQSDSINGALTANKIIYIGGCFLCLFILLIVLDMCRINVPRWVKISLIMFTVIVYLSVLTAGYSPIFYSETELVIKDDMPVIQKEYGIMHTVFYVMVIFYSLMSLAAIIFSFFRKKDVSRRIVYLLFALQMISVASYFVSKGETVGNIELVPLSYIFAQVIFLLIANRLCLYDITDSAADSLVQNGDTGLISFDYRFNYLGSNGTAKKIFPEINELRVDGTIMGKSSVSDTFLRWLGDFRRDNTKNKIYHKIGENIYCIDVNYLYDGRHRRGYQLYISDDTKNQQYIALIDSYNSDLREEVKQKTQHIVEMHDKLILSMATMVESRDNSTGGHIRRTSDVVRILVDEMKKDESLGLSEEFCRNIIKAAPMHDLGKIAVDDAILRKPGRFTDEEFEKMKAHAAEGAKIVHKILEGTDDINFHIIAENVAHYHHERWDGSGYPEHLEGDDIPFEARIMAVADVYDALVSKRVYKEKMSYEKANEIIMDGMGKHFDKRLEPYYVKVRPLLEAYYDAQE